MSNTTISTNKNLKYILSVLFYSLSFHYILFFFLYVKVKNKKSDMWQIPHREHECNGMQEENKSVHNLISYDGPSKTNLIFRSCNYFRGNYATVHRVFVVNQPKNNVILYIYIYIYIYLFKIT